MLKAKFFKSLINVTHWKVFGKNWHRSIRIWLKILRENGPQVITLALTQAKILRQVRDQKLRHLESYAFSLRQWSAVWLWLWPSFYCPKLLSLPYITNNVVLPVKVNRALNSLFGNLAFPLFMKLPRFRNRNLCENSRSEYANGG